MLQSVTECYRVLQGITEYYRVLQSITDYYRVLQSIKEYYRILQIIRVLQGITEYQRVLQSITEHYRVLQSIKKTNLAHLLGPIFGLVGGYGEFLEVTMMFLGVIQQVVSSAWALAAKNADLQKQSWSGSPTPRCLSN